jgi:hypothetical protein
MNCKSVAGDHTKLGRSCVTRNLVAIVIKLQAFVLRVENVGEFFGKRLVEWNISLRLKAVASNVDGQFDLRFGV